MAVTEAIPHLTINIPLRASNTIPKGSSISNTLPRTSILLRVNTLLTTNMPLKGIKDTILLSKANHTAALRHRIRRTHPSNNTEGGLHNTGLHRRIQVRVSHRTIPIMRLREDTPTLPRARLGSTCKAAAVHTLNSTTKTIRTIRISSNNTVASMAISKEAIGVLARCSLGR